MPEQELPGILGEIAELCGREAAEKIAKAKGGARAYIPAAKRLHAAHWLVSAVGMEDAKKICDALVTEAGLSFDIPSGSSAARVQRWRAVNRMLAEGASAAVIARTLSINERTVRRIRNGDIKGAALAR